MTSVPARASPRRPAGIAAVLTLLLAACAAPAPAGPSPSAPPAAATGKPVETMRPEAATYGRQYCAAVTAWNLALDDAIDWSTRARLDATAASLPDPDTAADLEAMRAEIAGIAAFAPVVPIARALTRAADRMERVVGLLGPVMADPAASSTVLEQDLPRLSADMASAAEYHHVAESNYGPMGCAVDVNDRVGPSAWPVSVTPPAGWREFGPSKLKRQAQLDEIRNPEFADRLLSWAELGEAAAVLYDAANPGSSDIGAVVWMSFDPQANDLLASMEWLEAELATDSTLSDVVVRYVDRPAGDAGRLVAHAKTDDRRDLYIIDVVRVTDGMILVVSLMPESDAPTYWLAIEQIVGSLRVDDADPPGQS